MLLAAGCKWRMFKTVAAMCAPGGENLALASRPIQREPGSPAHPRLVVHTYSASRVDVELRPGASRYRPATSQHFTSLVEANGGCDEGARID